jgi:hypothetical protein
MERQDYPSRWGLLLAPFPLPLSLSPCLLAHNLNKAYKIPALGIEPRPRKLRALPQSSASSAVICEVATNPTSFMKPTKNEVCSAKEFKLLCIAVIRTINTDSSAWMTR